MKNYPELFKNLPTPCYVLDEELLVRNLELCKKIEEKSGCKILLAQKAFSMYSLYPLIGKYLSGTTASGLHDSSQGRGPLPTWPADSPLLRIPLDHCFHSGDVRILAKRPGPDIGSDHLPLIIDLAF